MTNKHQDNCPHKTFSGCNEMVCEYPEHYKCTCLPPMTNKHNPENNECPKNGCNFPQDDCIILHACTCPPSEDINKTPDFVSKTEEDVNKPTTSPDSQYREDKEVGEEALRLEWKQYIDFAVGDDDSIEGLTYRGVADWWMRKLATKDAEIAQAEESHRRERGILTSIASNSYARGKEDGAREMRVKVRDWADRNLNAPTEHDALHVFLASLTPLLNDKKQGV